MLFLTYHKVSPEKPPRSSLSEFYTLSVPELDAQLRTLLAAELTPLSLPQLMSGRPFKRSFILSFDDGTDDHYHHVFPLLQTYNLQAIFFVPTAALDTPGHLTSQQMRTMIAAGHHFGCHSHDHIRLDRLPQEKVDIQLRAASAIISSFTGGPPLLFAPPGGFTSHAVRSACATLGIPAIRTMKWGFNTDPILPHLECIPINGDTTPERFKGLLAERLPITSNIIYNTKEALKHLLPDGTYTSLRNWIKIR